MVWVDIDNDILKKVQETTITDYEGVDGKVTVESLKGMVEDLLIELENKDDEIRDIIEDRESNYRPLTAHELYD
jgi:hypothetical protein